MSTPGLATRAAQANLRSPENSPASDPRQVAVPPTPADARVRLVDLIRRRPAPKPEPNYWTARDEDRLQRRLRLQEVQRILRPISGNLRVATAIGVSTRTILHWRAGTRRPSVRLWHQVRALRALLSAGGRL